MITKIIRGLAYGVISMAVAWDTLAIGNGKTLTIGRRSVFIAANSDMTLAFVLSGLAVLALALLMAMAIIGQFTKGKKIDYPYANTEYSRYGPNPWHQSPGAYSEDGSRGANVDQYRV